MLHLLKNQKGITLVEVLAILIIFSIISSFVMGIMSNSNNSHKVEIQKYQEINNISSTFKIITKDVRKTLNVEYDKINNIYTLNTNDELVKYELVKNSLLRNGQKINTSIHTFNIDQSAHSLQITTLDGKSTTVYFRGASFSEKNS